MKTLLFILMCSFCTHIAMAQKTILTTGGNATGSGGTVSYSVGQTDYIKASGANGSALQGVQQPFETSTLGVDNAPQISLSFLVYPNPTTSIVNLKIGDFNAEDLQFVLYDIQGRQLISQKIRASLTPISFENFAAANYFLKIANSNQVIKTFKIIKN